MSSTRILACVIACLTSRMSHDRWCFAVSLGRKPWPGGETKVWRMLERMRAGPGLDGWWMRPTPSLLAEPSRPIAIMIETINPCVVGRPLSNKVMPLGATGSWGWSFCSLAAQPPQVSPQTTFTAALHILHTLYCNCAASHSSPASLWYYGYRNR